MTATHRSPYVGDGADGCRRSADIDRSEADTYPTGSPDWQRCRDSADRWDAQAADVGEHTVRPTGATVSQAMAVSLTPPELEALGMACGEISSGEMYGWSEQRADALARAHTKITRALDGGDQVDDKRRTLLAWQADPVALGD